MSKSTITGIFTETFSQRHFINWEREKTHNERQKAKKTESSLNRRRET